jgi:hypothetical protein
MPKVRTNIPDGNVFIFGRGGAWETTPQCEDHLLIHFAIWPFSLHGPAHLLVFFLALALETVHIDLHMSCRKINDI